MRKRKTSVPFRGTAEQREKLRQVIEKHRDEKGALMPVLQQAQEIYGYLPIEVQRLVSEGMDIPLEEVYGVVSFYSQFSLNPKGRVSISVCMGTACYVKGSQAVLDRLVQKLGIQPGEVTPDGQFSLDAARCMGACGLAPVMVVNGEVYGRLVPDDVDRILEKYRSGT